MLGILGIEMNIEYGEEERAMNRLEKIIEQKEAAKTDSPSPETSGKAGRQRRADIGLKIEAPGTKNITKLIEDRIINVENGDNRLLESR